MPLCGAEVIRCLSSFGARTRAFTFISAPRSSQASGFRMDSIDKLSNWKERVKWWEKVSIPLDKLSDAPTSASLGESIVRRSCDLNANQRKSAVCLEGNDTLSAMGPGRFSTFSSLSIISPLSETTLLEQFTTTIQPLINLLDDLSQVWAFSPLPHVSKLH